MASLNFLSGLAGISQGLVSGSEKAKDRRERESSRKEEIRQFEATMETQAEARLFQENMEQQRFDASKEMQNKQLELMELQRKNEVGQDMEFLDNEGNPFTTKVSRADATRIFSARDEITRGTQPFLLSDGTEINATPDMMLRNQQALESNARETEKRTLEAFVRIAGPLFNRIDQGSGQAIPPSRRELDEIMDQITRITGAGGSVDKDRFFDNLLDETGNLTSQGNQLILGEAIIPAGRGASAGVDAEIAAMAGIPQLGGGMSLEAPLEQPQPALGGAPGNLSFFSQVGQPGLAQGGGMPPLQRAMLKLAQGTPPQYFGPGGPGAGTRPDPFR